MKNLRKILFILLVGMVYFPVSAKNDPVQLTLTNPSIKKTMEEVHISFDIQAAGVYPNYKITFAPVLYNENLQFVDLPPVSVVGRQMDRQERRGGRALGARTILRKKETRVIRYTASVPFEDWMQLMSVAVYPFVEGCDAKWEETPMVLAEDRLLYYNLIPYFSDQLLEYTLTELEKYDLENPFLHPMEDYHKRYDILGKDRDKGSSKIIFKVGSSVIDTDMSDNRQVLDAILKAFDLIEKDPNAILKHIFVAGYASPEGSLAFNTKLAHGRAESVKQFIQRNMSSSNEELFELYNGREDWQGLREKVENSTMPEKQDILHIIDSYKMEQENRKTELKKLNGGGPYRFMLENFYPPLRSAGYVQVYYEIDRTATVATAFTDEHGRTTWIDPDSPWNRGVTAINQAVELMKEFRFAEALQLMVEFDEDPRSWNNLGACYMMLRDFEKAEYYLSRAEDAGDPYASRNLEQIGWVKKIEQ